MAKTINFTTGPVNPEQKVVLAFHTPPVSHRSLSCRNTLEDIGKTLSRSLGTKEVFLMNGSGTLANEAMIAHIARSGEKGLILSNGEFGERLINQFSRYHRNFSTLQKEWGHHFSPAEIISAIESSRPSWLLVCHHETSTGVLNDLKGISNLCKQYAIALFADCISSVGNTTVDLTEVAMATGSSGKGLGAFPGVALVFSNIEITSCPQTPVYLDLGYYRQADFLPFTISSNLLFALQKALETTLNTEHHKKNIYLSSLLKTILQKEGFHFLNPSESPEAFVFSLVLPETHNSRQIGEKLKEQGILISYESAYLLKRNMVQLSLMGVHFPDEIELLVKKFMEVYTAYEIIKV